MLLSAIVEALLISSANPLTTKKMAELVRAEYAKSGHKGDLEATGSSDILIAIASLNQNYQAIGSSFHVIEQSTGWLIRTRPEFAKFIQRLTPEKKPKSLNQATLETLAVIAYRQPTTKVAIETIRGVSCDSAIKKLFELKIIADTGVSDLPGSPKLYQTTPTFFDYLGISDINELPNLEELRESQISQTT